MMTADFDHREPVCLNRIGNLQGRDLLYRDLIDEREILMPHTEMKSVDRNADLWLVDQSHCFPCVGKCVDAI